MGPEKWDQLKELAHEKFDILEEEFENVSEELGGGTVDRMVFESPLGKVKVEFVSKPKVLSRKSQFSKRGGTAFKVDYTLSPDQVVHTFLVYKWNDMADDWQNVDPEAFGF